MIFLKKFHKIVCKPLPPKNWCRSLWMDHNLEFMLHKLKMVPFDQKKIIPFLHSKGQIISECPLEILDFPKIPRKI